MIDTRLLVKLLIDEVCQTKDITIFKNWLNTTYNINCYAISSVYYSYGDLFEIGIYINNIINPFDNIELLEIKKKYIHTVDYSYILKNIENKRSLMSIIKKWFATPKSKYAHQTKTITTNDLTIKITDQTFLNSTYFKKEYLKGYLHREISDNEKLSVVGKYGVKKVILMFSIVFFVQTEKEKNMLLCSESYVQLKYSFYELYKKYDVLNLIDYDYLEQLFEIESIENFKKKTQR